MITKIHPIRAMRHGAVWGLAFGILQADIAWNFSKIAGVLMGSIIGGVVLFALVVKLYNSFVH